MAATDLRPSFANCCSRKVASGSMQYGRGMCIAVLGPDGAGKSAMIAQLETAVGSEFSGIDVHHFRPASGRQHAGRPVTRPHEQTPRSAIGSVAKLLFLMVVFRRDFLFHVRPRIAAGRLVIFDRYFDDLLVDPLRYRLPQSCVWLARVLARFIPRPDLWLVLDVDPHRVQRRKCEVAFAESCRQAAGYRVFATSVAAIALIDANQTVEQVVAEAAERIQLEHARLQLAGTARLRAEKAKELAQRVFGPLQTAASVQLARAVQSGKTNVLAVGASQPRWFIPERNPKANIVLRGWSPYRTTSKMLWLGIRAASYAGVLQGLPGIMRCTLDVIDEADWQRLGWEWPGNPVPMVYLGTVGPQQKAVIHLIDSASGYCRLIIKVPLTSAAGPAILHEAAVLAELERTGYPFAPHLVSVDRERAISTQNYVDGRVAQPKPIERFFPLMQSLRADKAVVTIAEHCAIYERAYRSEPTGSGNLLDAAFLCLRDETPLAAFHVHGDFAPWNIRRQANGSFDLIDWEDAQLYGLPLQDALHYLHIRDFAFQRRPGSYARQLVSLAAMLGVPGHLTPTLEVAYLVHQYLRRSKLRQQEQAAFLLKSLRIAVSNYAARRRQILVPDLAAHSAVSA